MQGLPRRSILYYPRIAVPSGQWLRRALLYWDEVASIVPVSWETAGNRLTRDVETLAAAGHFRPVRPEEVIAEAWNQYDEMVDEFSRRVVTGRHSDSHHPDEQLNSGRVLSLLHGDKASSQLLQFLQRRGLASPVDGGWWEVEQQTYVLYMGMLATFISSIERTATVIGTDDPAYERLALGTNSEGSGLPSLDVHMINTLPVPHEDTSIERILRFKEEHRAELLAFRSEVGLFHRALSESDSLQEIHRVSTAFSERLYLGVSSLAATLHDQRILGMLGSLKTLLTFSSVALLDAVQAIGLNVETPVEFKVVGLLGGGTIKIGHEYIESRSGLHNTLRNSPYAYVYHANRSGVLAG